MAFNFTLLIFGQVRPQALILFFEARETRVWDHQRANEGHAGKLPNSSERTALVDENVHLTKPPEFTKMQTAFAELSRIFEQHDARFAGPSRISFSVARLTVALVSRNQR